MFCFLVDLVFLLLNGFSVVGKPYFSDALATPSANLNISIFPVINHLFANNTTGLIKIFFIGKLLEF